MPSTINPSTLDPTKPTTGEALTADVRANETATQNNFAAAVVDIEALQAGQAGKEDAGVAAGLVDDHDASAAAHGAVEQGLADHKISADHDGRYYTETEADARYLQNVADDATPVLGGDLRTAENPIVVTLADDTEVGQIGAITSDGGIYFARSLSGVPYDGTDGGIAALPGSLEIHGSAAVVAVLQHAEPAGRQVYVAQNGGLYSVEPPPPGWSDSSSDAAAYAMATLGLWVRIAGLTTTAAEAVSFGDRVDIAASLYVLNDSVRDGAINIGWGVNGAIPTGAGNSYTISAGFDARVPVSLTSVALTLAPGDEIDVWAQRSSQSNPAFSPVADGSTAGGAHESYLSVPGESGGYASPTTTQGDMIVRGVSVDERLAKGSDDQIMTMVAGSPAWAASQSGGVTTYLGLNDTPATFSGAGKVAMTSSANNALVNATIIGGDNINVTAGDFDLTVAYSGPLGDMLAPAGGVLSGNLYEADVGGGAQTKDSGVKVVDLMTATDTSDLTTGYTDGGALVASGSGTWEPDFSVRGRVFITGTSALTVTEPATDGEMTVYVANGATVALVAGWLFAGTQASGQTAIATVARIGGESFWLWGPSTTVAT